MPPLTPILNSGFYHIRNIKYGAIRDDEGALGAKGNSKDPELLWHVTRNPDASYTLTTVTPPAGDKPYEPGTKASPGGVISEIEKRFYISDDPDNVAPATSWVIQPILTGSQPPILYVIYQLPNHWCPDLGHWELNNSDKKEPVKLNRDPTDEENKPVPSLYGENALWCFEVQPNPYPQPRPHRYT